MIYTAVRLQCYRDGGCALGLNVFNAKYVLASAETATDMDYQNIESVIGHEYFHNWTGNRITCRDWFQLSLKGIASLQCDHVRSKQDLLRRCAGGDYRGPDGVSRSGVLVRHGC